VTRIAMPHESAAGHVSGAALYTDDLVANFPGILHAWPVLAPHAHALLTHLDAIKALDEPGVVTTLTAADVPGEGDSGANKHDEPLFPIEIAYHSQPVAWVLGETQEAARLGAARVVAECRCSPFRMRSRRRAFIPGRSGSNAEMQFRRFRRARIG
jgi:xanthine dehydrogenase large subunit